MDAQARALDAEVAGQAPEQRDLRAPGKEQSHEYGERPEEDERAAERLHAGSMPMERVFVYGTLLFPEMASAVAGRPLPFREAVLPGFARRGLARRPYPGLLAAPGEETPGRLLETLDAAALARLDRYEGALYERVRVRVRAADAPAPEEAWTFLLREAHRDLALATPWDPEAFAAAHLARYLEALSGDSPAPGSARSASTTRRMRRTWDPSQ